MTREEWAFIISFIVMLVMCSSYFFKKKSVYLSMQGAGILFLMVAYTLERQYFAMAGLGIGLVRSAAYLFYEYNDRPTPIGWPIGFTLAGVACYCIINFWILGDSKPYDILYLVGLAAYAFIFCIRNLTLLRYLVLFPTALSILYNVLIGSAYFVWISYTFELCANIVAIIRYRLTDKKNA